MAELLSDNVTLYEEAMEKGRWMSLAERWADAARAYQTAVCLRPDDYSARVQLALALYRCEKLDEAYAEYAAVLRQSPDDVTVVLRMAEIQQRLGKPDSAAELYVRAAYAYLQKGQREKARKIWRHTAATYGDDPRCLEILRKACAKAGEKQLESDVQLAIAFAFAEIADYRRAVQACRRALELDAANDRARQALESLEAGTSDWRSLRLLGRFDAVVGEGTVSSQIEMRTSSIGRASDRSAASTSPQIRPESLRELVPLGNSVELARWLIEEADRLEQRGDLASAVATLCQPFEDEGGREEHGLAAIKQRLAYLLRDREHLRVDELAAMPFEARRVAVERMIEAYNWLERGLKAVAEHVCFDLIEDMPGYLAAQMLLADICAAGGRTAAACEKYAYLAHLYGLRNEQARAAEAMVKLIDLHDGGEKLSEHLAALATEPGNLELAVKHLASKAQSSLAQNDLRGAYQYLATIVELVPNDVQFSTRFAEVATALGENDSAYAAYKKAIESEANSDTLLNFMLLSARTRDWSEPELYLDRFLSLVESDAEFAAKIIQRLMVDGNEKKEIKLCLAAALQSLGRIDQADRLLREISDDDSVVAWIAIYLLAREGLRQGEAAQSIELLRSGLERVQEKRKTVERSDHASTSLLWLRSRYLQCMKQGFEQLKDLVGVVTVLQQMKADSFDNASVCAELVVALAALGDIDGALRELDELKKMLLASGSVQQAKTIFDEMLARVSGSGDVTLRKRICEFLQAFGLNDDVARELESLAQLELAKGMVADAAESLRRLMELYRDRYPRKALVVKDKLARLMPEDTALRVDLAVSYLKAGLAGKAILCARSLAGDLIAQRRYEDAIRPLEQILEIDPWNIWALEQLGNALCAVGRAEQGIEVYRQLLAIDPRNVKARSALSHVAR